MAVRRDGLGKDSRTTYRVIERFPQGFTLASLHPVTGRQHQLRVHMSAIGHPLAADPKYGGGYRLELYCDGDARTVLDRYALHAAELVFRHPESRVELRISAPLAADLQATINLLRRGANEVVAGTVVSRQ